MQSIACKILITLLLSALLTLGGCKKEDNNNWDSLMWDRGNWQ